MTESGAAQALQELLVRLISDTNDLTKQADVPSEYAEAIVRDVESVTREIGSAAPRVSVVTRVLGEVRDAATAVGTAGAPVAETVRLIMDAFR